jgi:uncharacterized protein
MSTTDLGPVIAGSGPATADLAELLARFGARLRVAGIPVAPNESIRLARVIELRQPATVTELYWCARVSLLRSADQLDRFDAIFGLVFRGLADPAEHRGDTAAPQPAPKPARPEDGPSLSGDGAPQPRSAVAPGRSGGGPSVATRTVASSAERLREADFAALTAEELAELTPLLRELVTALPRRRSRRRRLGRHGDRLDVRACLRRSVHYGGDPAVPIRTVRRQRPRQLVALLDISGSMQPYALAYLHLLWGAAARAQAEVFVFGTRLTRLTRVLHRGSPDVALAAAARLMPDWSGGTRIGQGLKAFLDRYGRRGMAHGAVVVIVSDGWERDDPALLGAQMAALASRAYRVIWVNPRAAAPEFAPLTGGMQAALPHVDVLVSGHSAAAVSRLVGALQTGR